MLPFFFIILAIFHYNKAGINDSYFHKAQGTRFEGMDFESEGKWNGPFFFIQMADCQLGFFNNNLSWEKEIEHLEKAVEKINRLKPKFVIVCGDLTHAKPFKESYPYQVRDYKKTMSKISSEIPLVCVCGNHDVGNKPRKETIKAYEDNFGSHYFSFFAGGTQCFVLNSSLYNNPEKAPDIFKEQKKWVKDEMKRTKHLNPVHRFVFTHHPWFLKNAEVVSSSYFEIPLKRRLKAVKFFVDQKVTACFAGHYHRNAHALYQGMEMITTSALGKPLGKDPSGLRIVKVFRDKIKHRYYPLDEIPDAVNLAEGEMHEITR